MRKDDAAGMDASRTDAPARTEPSRDWPSEADWIWNGPLAAPTAWERPGLVMAFNLECAGCVARGIPLLKRLANEHGDGLQIALLHTAYGHREVERDDVADAVLRFSDRFARLPFPVAIDVDGSQAQRWGAEGTPHWFVFSKDGSLARSFYGSQDNARTRLEYLVSELVTNASR